MNSIPFFSSLFCNKSSLHISSARLIHSTRCCFAVEKSLLAKIRKRTGFSISECKKALEQHDNDLEKAEEWMIKEAQNKGWAKALNLSGRAAVQGLVGVHVQNNIGSIVEVNCETDFVARNEEFQSLVLEIAQRYCSFGLEQQFTDSLKINNSKEELEALKTEEGKKLSDLVALTIGKIGENIQIKRGSLLRASDDTSICSYVHPSTAENPRSYGKFGSLGVFKDPTNDVALQKSLCAHIVGMNPLSIGSLDDEELKDSSSDSSESSSSDSDSDSDEENKSEQKEDENRLLFQEFLSNDNVKVKDVLSENKIEVLDFIRYECGETVEEVD